MKSNLKSSKETTRSKTRPNLKVALALWQIYLEENFEILGCSNSDSFETVRDSYLALAKIYHPDRHSNKSESIKNEYNAKFKKIQAAYEALKPFFKNQENFIKVG
ncbi:J domain-containing protein [Campylobacter concisus]